MNTDPKHCFEGTVQHELWVTSKASLPVRTYSRPDTKEKSRTRYPFKGSPLMWKSNSLARYRIQYGTLQRGSLSYLLFLISNPSVLLHRWAGSTGQIHILIRKKLSFFTAFRIIGTRFLITWFKWQKTGCPVQYRPCEPDIPFNFFIIEKLFYLFTYLRCGIPVYFATLQTRWCLIDFSWRELSLLFLLL